MLCYNIKAGKPSRAAKCRCEPHPCSALALGAVEGGTAVLGDAAYGAAAALAETGLVGAVIDREAFLEAAGPAVGLAVVAERRAACRHGFFEHGAGGARQRLGPGASGPGRDRAGAAQRRQPSPPQRLAHIDVAEPSHEPLVHQRGLEARAPAAKGGDEPRSVERRRQRFDAEMPEQRMAVETGFVSQDHEAEAARVVVDDADAARAGLAALAGRVALELEDHMVVP